LSGRTVEGLEEDGCWWRVAGADLQRATAGDGTPDDAAGVACAVGSGQRHGGRRQSRRLGDLGPRTASAAASSQQPAASSQQQVGRRSGSAPLAEKHEVSASHAGPALEERSGQGQRWLGRG
ncbi:hypothetical protein BS50DRAFT_653446, partial [Corynespora cassiicola Philippines]